MSPENAIVMMKARAVCSEIRHLKKAIEELECLGERKSQILSHVEDLFFNAMEIKSDIRENSD